MPPIAGSHAWKLFLPSWNFFDDLSSVPRLEYRVIDGAQNRFDWQPLFPECDTASLLRVAFNPWGNLELFERSWIERAAGELHAASAETMMAFPKSETFSILSRIVQRSLFSPKGPALPNATFEFRICRGDPEGAEGVLFVSPVLPLVIES